MTAWRLSRTPDLKVGTAGGTTPDLKVGTAGGTTPDLKVGPTYGRPHNVLPKGRAYVRQADIPTAFLQTTIVVGPTFRSGVQRRDRCAGLLV